MTEIPYSQICDLCLSYLLSSCKYFMRISLVYFRESLSSDRQHHEVNDFMLRDWVWFYKNSKTSFEPCLLVDKKESVPCFWNYDYKIVEDCDPPMRQDVLQKVGWIKSQSYNLLGDCVVMDIDAFIVSCIDELADLDTPIAMPEDRDTYTRDWWFYPTWPEVNPKHNAGVMLMKRDCLKRFREIWNEKFITYGSVTFFDELIFNHIKNEIGGTNLPIVYNDFWKGKVDFDTKVVHFNGRDKDYMKDFKRAFFL